MSTDSAPIVSPIYDPRLPWWVSVLCAAGLCACVMVLFWAIKLLVLG